MKLKTCTGCGRPFRPRFARAARCDACRPRGRDDRSPTTRAQDAEYAAERAVVLQPGPDGLPPLCYWGCGRRATTADHLRHVSRGGQHRSNLVPSCGHCNFSRADRPAPRVVTDALEGDGPLAERVTDELARQAKPTRLA